MHPVSIGTSSTEAEHHLAAMTPPLRFGEISLLDICFQLLQGLASKF